MTEWAKLLEASAGAFGVGAEEAIARVNPALRLVDFFKGMLTSQSQEAFASIVMDTTKAVQVAESFREASLPQLSQENVMSWLSYWKKIGFM